MLILWEDWAGVIPHALGQLAQALSQNEVKNTEQGSVGRQFHLSSNQIYAEPSSGSSIPQEPRSLRLHLIIVPRRLREAWRDIRIRRQRG